MTTLPRLSWNAIEALPEDKLVEYCYCPAPLDVKEDFLCELGVRAKHEGRAYEALLRCVEGDPYKETRSSALGRLLPLRPLTPEVGERLVRALTQELDAVNASELMRALGSAFCAPPRPPSLLRVLARNFLQGTDYTKGVAAEALRSTRCLGEGISDEHLLSLVTEMVGKVVGDIDNQLAPIAPSTKAALPQRPSALELALLRDWDFNDIAILPLRGATKAAVLAELGRRAEVSDDARDILLDWTEHTPEPQLRFEAVQLLLETQPFLRQDYEVFHLCQHLRSESSGDIICEVLSFIIGTYSPANPPPQYSLRVMAQFCQSTDPDVEESARLAVETTTGRSPEEWGPMMMLRFRTGFEPW